MDYISFFTTIKDHSDSNQAAKMSAYMRNKFAFLGIPTPKRKTLCKEFFKIKRKENSVDWEFINNCWKESAREFQYVAVDYLNLVQNHLTPADIPKMKSLAIEKSWWDTIDGLDKLVGRIALDYPEVNATLLEWSRDENMWLRRIAIDHQLGRKEKTNTELLEKILVNNLGETEFFINKAIGWSLRDYSKINPEWVRGFILQYQDRLAPMSMKEASKYLEPVHTTQSISNQNETGDD